MVTQYSILVAFRSRDEAGNQKNQPARADDLLELPAIRSEYVPLPGWQNESKKENRCRNGSGIARIAVALPLQFVPRRPRTARTLPQRSGNYSGLSANC